MRVLDKIWIGLSGLLLVLTVMSCICVATIFVNPDGVFSFLAGPTQPVPEILSTAPPFLSPTATISFPTLPPEWTTAPEAATATETPPNAGGTATATPGEGLTGGNQTPIPSPVGPTATDTDELLPTRTPTLPPLTPTRTATPGSYPAPRGTPTPTATTGSYP